MPGKRARGGVDPAQVFLNVPYNRSYERTLVALTAALVAVGRVPRLTFQIPDVGQGRLLPTTSVDQLGAALAGWFGVPASDLPTVFPKIVHFDANALSLFA